MPRGVILQLCLMAGVSLWTNATPLPPHSSGVLPLAEQLGQRKAKESVLEQRPTGGGEPVATPATPFTPSSPAAASEMGSNPTNSWSPELQMSEPQGSSSGAGGLAGRRGGSEAPRVSVKVSAWGDREQVAQEMGKENSRGGKLDAAGLGSSTVATSGFHATEGYRHNSPPVAEDQMARGGVHTAAPRTTSSPQMRLAVVKYPGEPRKVGGASEQGHEHQLLRQEAPALERDEKGARGADEVLMEPPTALLGEEPCGQTAGTVEPKKAGLGEDLGPRGSAALEDLQLPGAPGAPAPSYSSAPSHFAASSAHAESGLGDTGHSLEPLRTGLPLSQDEAGTVGGMPPGAMPTAPAGGAVAGSHGASALQDGNWSALPEKGAVTAVTLPLSTSPPMGPPKEVTAAVDAPTSSYSAKTQVPLLTEGPSAPWQTSGTELSDTVSLSQLQPLTAPPPGPPLDYGSLESEDLGVIKSPPGATETSTVGSDAVSAASVPFRTSPTAVTSLSLPKSKSGLEELESEEEHDEDDEDTEESEEEESQEDTEETPTPAPHAYSHVPYHLYSNSIWVQRHQGLVRSWVEKIRDKAGYVSGMLAPVGIGVAGALFILGALYSIKVMHRKRRSSFKHQRRKHRETTSRQDRVMLLADSSEDEF
ncbi:armadillo-like helical domain-containing protein 4 [Scleropages formosus]|nr:armadillo-like helical domain-containing protein 4 [Scleropages formosus]